MVHKDSRRWVRKLLENTYKPDRPESGLFARSRHRGRRLLDGQGDLLLCAGEVVP